jgi:amino acid transporter
VLVSLAASLQTTLIYLSRSIFAMGRSGLMPAAFGALDRRDQPALAVGALTAIGMAGTLASGTWPTIRAAFDFILNGTSFFLGVLFLMTGAAAVRLFAGDAGARWSGVIWPAIGVIALAYILTSSLVQGDAGTRAFIVGAALVGIPLALWRGRHAAPARVPLGAVGAANASE